jgi:Tfp pilus assembly protein PilO
MKEQWKELLEESRNNYLAIVQSLSKMQKQLEKIMVSTAENGISYQNDFTKMLAQWVNIGNQIRDDLKEIFEQNLKTTYDSFSMNMPFKDELDKLYQNIHQSFEKYFENLQDFDFLSQGKKEKK